MTQTYYRMTYSHTDPANANRPSRYELAAPPHVVDGRLHLKFHIAQFPDRSVRSLPLPLFLALERTQ